MIFSEGTQVIYNNMFGVIDFVCDNYVVIKTKAATNKNNCPRLLVFKEKQKEIQLLKESEK